MFMVSLCLYSLKRRQVIDAVFIPSVLFSTGAAANALLHLLNIEQSSALSLLNKQTKLSQFGVVLHLESSTSVH